MKYDRSLVRGTFFMGLLMTAGGALLLIYAGWNEATVICLGVGLFFLFCALVIVLSYKWMAHIDIASRLPEDWANLSPEARHAFARKRATEESNKGNKGARVTLWLMRLSDAQRRHGEAPVAERDDIQELS